MRTSLGLEPEQNEGMAQPGRQEVECRSQRWSRRRDSARHPAHLGARYGFPHPGRDLRDERSYAAEEVEKLRLIATWWRVACGPGAWCRWAPSSSPPWPARPAARTSTHAAPATARILCWTCCGGMTAAVWRAILKGQYAAWGWLDSSPQRMARLNELVGKAGPRRAAGLRGALYTEMVAQLVHHATGAAAAAARGTPHVLLATFPPKATAWAC
jgi:hypothetical protein